MKNAVVCLMCCVLKGRVGVLAIEERVIGQDLLGAGAISQKLENVGRADALSPNAGAASALAFFK